MRRLAPASRLLFVVPLLACGLSAQGERDSESFQVGIGLLQRELYDEAAKKFEQFLREHPGHTLGAEAKYRLATCRLELGQTADAVAPLQEALQAGGGRFKLRAEAQYRLAGALHQTAEHDAAHAVLAELLSATDGKHYLRAAALFLDGECLRDAKHDAEAARAFDAAAEADTDAQGGHAVPARYQAGFARLRLGDFGGAEAAFRAAAQSHPAHPACAECWYLAGDAAYRGGRFQEALQAFGASEALPGEFQDDAALGAAWATLQLGDRGTARTRFAHVTDAYGTSPLAAKARLEVGRLQQQDGEQAAARATLAPLTTGGGVEPGLRAEADEIIGLAAAAQGEHAAALAALQSALAAAPAAARARILVAIGASQAAQSDWQAAQATYTEAAKVASEPLLAGEALYGMCLAAHRLGAFEESLRLAQQFAREQPEHRLRAHAALAVAENLFALRRYADAEAAYAPLTAEGGTFALDAQFKRAWSVYLQGRQAEAADLFAELATDKNAAHAEEALSMLALAALEAGNPERALEAADRYQVRYPDGAFLARTERVASRSLQAAGDLAGAAKRLAAAATVEGAPERSRQDRLEVAELLFKKSDFAAAATAYEELLTGDDAVAARGLEGRAWCAFELGDDARCLALVDRALAHPALGARLPDALQLRCAVLQRTGQHEAAAASAARFVAECRDDARVPAMRYAQGLSLLRADKPREAREVLAALARDGGGPNPDRTAYELAWACSKSGDEAAALAAFAEVLRLTKDEELAGESALHLGEALLGQAKTEDARTLLLQVHGQHRARALYRAAFADLEAQPARALAVFAQILDEKLTGPFADDTRFLVGEAAQRAGDQAEAARRYAAALQALPEHERAQAARVRAGEAGVQSERAGDAVAWLEEYLRRDDAGAGDKLQRARAELWLGQARAARREWKAAVAAFQKVTELTDTELAAEAQFRLGAARRSDGDLDGAVDAFVKLSILYGHAEWVQRGLFEAGCCYRDLGQGPKAERFFAELAQRFPDSSWTRRVKEGHVNDDKRPR